MEYITKQVKKYISKVDKYKYNQTTQKHMESIMKKEK